MTNPQFAGHPFGTTVTAETLRNTFAPLTQWEDKYRQLIMLGKQLPALPDELKAQAKEIAGCENRVWLGYTVAENGKMHFFGDSEGRIVRGLLAVLLTAVEGKTAAELQAQSPFFRRYLRPGRFSAPRHVHSGCTNLRGVRLPARSLDRYRSVGL